MAKYCFLDKSRVCDEGCTAYGKSGYIIGVDRQKGESMPLTSPCLVKFLAGQIASAILISTEALKKFGNALLDNQ